MNHQSEINKSPLLSRRSALKGLGALGAAGTLSAHGFSAPETIRKIKLEQGSVIVFQGDSITDAGRNRDLAEANHEKSYGRGYVGMLAGSLFGKYPELNLKVYNRGISGNKIPDLAARWQQDTIDLKPNVVSILIGVNDHWHQLGQNPSYSATLEDYENGYRELIQRTLRELPGVQIVIGEAFTTRKGEFDPVDDYAAVCKKLADEFNLVFVPYDQTIERLVPAHHKDFWLWDGIHPTVPGHALLADTWRKATGL